VSFTLIVKDFFFNHTACPFQPPVSGIFGVIQKEIICMSPEIQINFSGHPKRSATMWQKHGYHNGAGLTMRQIVAVF